MKNYKLETLEKMLSRAKERYYQETAKPCNPRGYKMPNMNAWNRARDRYYELEEAIRIKKKEMEDNLHGA